MIAPTAGLWHYGLMAKTTESPMTGADMIAWMDRCGFSADTLSPLVGKSPRMIDAYRRDGVPRSVQMALAAIEMGVPPTWRGERLPVRLKD